MLGLYSVPPFLTLCCFLCLAGLTLYRGTKTKTNRLFLMLCILASLLYGAILLEFNAPSAEQALFVSRIDHLFIIFLTPLYLHFFFSYLAVKKHRWIVGMAYAYTFVLMVFVPTPYFVSHMEKHAFGYFARAGILYPLFGFGGLAVTFSSLFLIYIQMKTEQNQTKKNRLVYVMIGFGVMGVLTGLNFLPIHGIPVYPPGNFSFIPLSIFAVGLFKHDLLDMGILIKKSIVYSILTALLTCFYAFLVIFVNRVFTAFIISDSIIFPLCFFLFITFIFGPLKHGVQSLVDLLFSRSSYDYQATLKALSRQIVSLLDIETIGGQLLSTIDGAMRVRNGELFLNMDRKGNPPVFRRMAENKGEMPSCGSVNLDILVSYLMSTTQPVFQNDLAQQRQPKDIRKVAIWMQQEGWVVGFPLVFGDHMNAVLFMGEKRSGEGYTRDDMDLLETLCSQSALAIENAKAYEQVEALNVRLEEKVAERTQALKNALAEKERTQEQLIRSESLAAIGQLVAGVAHELNNPLAGAISLIQTSVEDLEELNLSGPHIDPTTIDDMKFADKELRRARDIVRSLLDLSRQTDTYAEKVDINVVVRDALQILHNQYKNLNIPISNKFKKNLPLIHGNFAALGQVVVNIVKNAIQSVKNNNGEIIIHTYHDSREDEVVFRCSDKGPGIPESIQKDIFKPFFTTKEVGSGTGLGLYICHEIVKKHRGRLAFKSKVGKRTCFSVRLPAFSSI